MPLQVEEADDPRNPDDLSPNPFTFHNPWAGPMPGTSTNPYGPGINRPGGPPPAMLNVISGLFSSMLNPPNLGQQPSHPPQQLRRQSQRGRDAYRPRSAPGSRDRSRDQSSPQWHFYTNTGPGFSFTATSSVRHFPGGEGQRGGQPPPGGGMHQIHEYVPWSLPPHPPVSTYPLNSPMDRLLQTIMGDMEGPRNGPGHGNFPRGFHDIFQQMINPGGAPAGDFATTQEAFDQILSQLMNEHQTGSAPGPASAEAINGLPKKTVGAKEKVDSDCSICMQRPEEGEETVTLPCHHWFHFECAQSWLREHDTCPICREGIMPKDPATGPRTPGQTPLHNADPFLLARQQSGTRENPLLVPDSPLRERRRPMAGHRRHSSGPARSSAPSRRSTRSSRASDDSGGGAGGSNSGGGGGITNRVRNFFGGGGGRSGGESSRHR